MKKQLYKVNKGLAEKMLDLYFKYSELRLPFKIDDHFELFEFELDYLSSRTITKYDTYRYAKELNFVIDEFKVDKAILSFCWDELWEIELSLSLVKPIERGQTQSLNEIVKDVLEKESLFIIETHELIKFRYLVGLNCVELKIYK